MTFVSQYLAVVMGSMTVEIIVMKANLVFETVNGENGRWVNVQQYVVEELENIRDL